MHPKESFVKNIGHDGSGVHCGITNNYEVNIINKYPIKFTTKIEENTYARKKLEKFFNLNRR